MQPAMQRGQVHGSDVIKRASFFPM